MTAGSQVARRRGLDASLAVALLGLVISGYLTVEHYTSTVVLACPEGTTINCAKVTSSPWAQIAGVPVAVLGLGYFLAMSALVTPAAWRRRSLDAVRIAGVLAGAATVVYLIWIELYRVNAICLWCTAVHICTVGLLGTVLWRTANAAPSVEPDSASSRDASRV